MDADHLDFFKDIDDIRHSFREFARLLPADGMLIINADTPKYDYVTEALAAKLSPTRWRIRLSLIIPLPTSPTMSSITRPSTASAVASCAVATR